MCTAMLCCAFPVLDLARFLVAAKLAHTGIS